MYLLNIFFDQKCTGVDVKNSQIQFVHNDGTKETVEASCIIGADGAYSVLRQQLQKMEHYNYSQVYSDASYKELCIPANKYGEYHLPPNYLHIWPRSNFMMIALPNKDKSFTCTLFMPFKMFDLLKTEEDVLNFYNKHFCDAIPIMPNLAKDFFENPTGSLVTVRCEPYHYGNNTVLIGDAAHAVLPFYGQGMNAAFEDCNEFDKLFVQFEGDMNKILPNYTTLRKPDCDAIAQLAVENYEEMRAKVASPLFLYRKRFEAILHTLFPNHFIPQYTMIAFTNRRYSDVITKRNAQNALLNRLFVGSVTTLTVALAVALYFKQNSIRNLIYSLLRFKK